MIQGSNSPRLVAEARQEFFVFDPVCFQHLDGNLATQFQVSG